MKLGIHRLCRNLAIPLAVTSIPAEAAKAATPEDAVRCEDVASIGAATMDADRVVTMRLRSLPPGPIAEATFVYKPGDREYASTLAHIGGMVPGETKPVKPWC